MIAFSKILDNYKMDSSFLKIAAFEKSVIY